ncbi:MAG: hypothetical protein NTU98_00250 [Bacteroidetes bacterium]|nr:hypothetical protein [Bacteroidota bacterium]
MEKNETIKSVMFLLAGALLQLSTGFGNTWEITLMALFGIILFIVGLMKLKKGIDAKGQSAATILLVGMIIGLVGALLFMIPLVGIVGRVFFIIAFVLELIGYLLLGGSQTIGASGKSGTLLLLGAMVIGVIVSILGWVPIIGEIIGALLSLVAIILIFFGWLKIMDGLMESK